MSRVDSEEEGPVKKKRFFGVWVVGDKYNHPASYKGFSKDAGPLVEGPDNTNQTSFGTGVRIYCFEPSLTKTGKNVSKAVGHFQKSSVGYDFGTGVGIYHFEPSLTKQGKIVSKRRKNVSKDVGHVLKKSVRYDFGLKIKKSEKLDQPSQEERIRWLRHIVVHMPQRQSLST